MSQPRTLSQFSGKPMKTRPAADAEIKRGGSEEMEIARPFTVFIVTRALNGDKNLLDKNFWKNFIASFDNWWCTTDSNYVIRGLLQ